MRKLLMLAAMIALSAALAAPASAARKRNSNVNDDCEGFMECFFGTATFSGRGRVITWKKAKKYRPGSIVIMTRERALYFIEKNGKARRYRVGVGRAGFTWSGTSRIVRKAKWPTWTPPAEMRIREKKKYGRTLPRSMPGGINNPLGARALYIGGTLYRIHGTNNPSTIGRAVSSGCIRLTNDDIKDLYNRARVGARVYVYQ